MIVDLPRVLVTRLGQFPFSPLEFESPLERLSAGAVLPPTGELAGFNMRRPSFRRA